MQYGGYLRFIIKMRQLHDICENVNDIKQKQEHYNWPYPVLQQTLLIYKVNIWHCLLLRTLTHIEHLESDSHSPKRWFHVATTKLLCAYVKRLEVASLVFGFQGVKLSFLSFNVQNLTTKVKNTKPCSLARKHTSCSILRSEVSL